MRNNAHNGIAGKRWLVRNDGQLLIEVLVAILVGGIFLLGATVGIISLIRYNFETRGNQVASGLALDLMSSVNALIENDWHNIYDLTKGTTTPYYLVSRATSSAVVQGEESFLFNDVKAGLVGHWKFDEDSVPANATTAYDSSGRSADGTLVNGPQRAYGAACRMGGCLGMHAANDYVRVSNPADNSLNFGTGEFTAGFWFKANVVGNSGCVSNPVIKKGNLDSAGYAIGIDWGAMKAWVNGSSYSYAYPDDKKWHFVVVKRTGTQVVMYHDGAAVVRQGSSPSAITTASDLMIGGTYCANTMDGYVDDVRLYNRALSDDEVKTLYDSAVYTRYFNVLNVSRDMGGMITESGGTEDKSTQKVAATVEWDEGRMSSLTEYIARDNAAALLQTDWTGGSGSSEPSGNSTTTYSASSNINTLLIGSISLATTTASGWLESGIYDTQSPKGAAINNIMWQGARPAGTVVNFQLAYSNNPAGPWNYVGSDGTAATYFSPTMAGDPLEVTTVNNYRYLRYKAFLVPSGGAGPTVDDVIINYSR
jgi:hypothetical protein